MRLPTIFLFIFCLQSCKNIKNDDIEGIPIDNTVKYMANRSQCIDLSLEFFDSWKNANGKIEKSLLKMREHIKGDNVSEFSQLIKTVWKHQEKNNYYENKKDIGVWPVSKKKHLTLVDIILEHEKELVAGCGELFAWNSYMSRQFEEDKDGFLYPRMIEYPNNLDWVYPDNMTWMEYWLFVNIK